MARGDFSESMHWPFLVSYRMVPCPLVASSSGMALLESAPLDAHTLAGAGSG